LLYSIALNFGGKKHWWMKLHPPKLFSPIILSTENMEQIEDILRGLCPILLSYRRDFGGKNFGGW